MLNIESASSNSAFEPRKNNLRVAIIHYWLDAYRGGEKVVEAICEIYPRADIYTHIYKPENLPESITNHQIRTTFISKLPFAQKIYRHYLLLMPLALLMLNLKQYDLIISSESGPAKGIRKRKDALHICYCHSPMRYIWDMKDDYVRGAGFGFRALWKAIALYMRIWDRWSAKKVDYFIANSRFIAARIRKFYGRKATVIHPPVNTGKFSPAKERQHFYLTASQMVPYKKIHLVVEAFKALELPLIVIGDGPEMRKMQKNSTANITFSGKTSDADLKEKLETCKAFVFAGKEDFGIIFAEAHAAGAPIIAYRKGGIRDIAVSANNKEKEPTAVFFREQNVKSLMEAVLTFESNFDYFKAENCAKRANNFSKEKFKTEITDFINSKIKPLL